MNLGIERLNGFIVSVESSRKVTLPLTRQEAMSHCSRVVVSPEFLGSDCVKEI